MLWTQHDQYMPAALHLKTEIGAVQTKPGDHAWQLCSSAQQCSQVARYAALPVPVLQMLTGPDAAAWLTYLRAAPAPLVWTSVGMRVSFSPSSSLWYVSGSCSTAMVLAPSLGMRTSGWFLPLPSSCAHSRRQPLCC